MVYLTRLNCSRAGRIRFHNTQETQRQWIIHWWLRYPWLEVLDRGPLQTYRNGDTTKEPRWIGELALAAVSITLAMVLISISVVKRVFSQFGTYSLFDLHASIIFKKRWFLRIHSNFTMKCIRFLSNGNYKLIYHKHRF